MSTNHPRKFLLSTSFAALLLGGLSGCDPADDHDSGVVDEGGGVGDTGDDGDCSAPNDDGDVQGGVCAPEAPIGSSLLDYGLCETMDGRFIAACDASNSLLRPCDNAFIEWCNEQRGDVHACDQEQIPVLEVYGCSATSPLMPPCDSAFYAACDSIDGDGIDADPTQLQGGCYPPPTTLDAYFCCTSVDNKGNGTDCIQYEPTLTSCGDDQLFCAGSWSCMGGNNGGDCSCL